ncbi:MAG: hypothetical protein ACJ0PA_01170 [Flavobacteriaceae bacterium]
MNKLEKLIYSVKYLPQILYFGSASLMILVIFLEIFELFIPLFFFFVYMTYLAIKNYKSDNESGVRDPIEKLIYSNKYLPSLLYFGSVGLIGYNIYCNIIKETEFLNEYTETTLYILFFYITYKGLKRIEKLKNNK